MCLVCGPVGCGRPAVRRYARGLLLGDAAAVAQVRRVRPRGPAPLSHVFRHSSAGALWCRGYGQAGTVTNMLWLGRVDLWAASLVDQAGYF